MINKLMLYVFDNIGAVKLIMKTFVMTIFPAVVSGNFILVLPMFINYLIDSVDIIVKYFVGDCVKFNRETDLYVEKYLHLACNVDGIMRHKKRYKAKLGQLDYNATYPWPIMYHEDWKHLPDGKYTGYLNNGSIKVVVDLNTIYFYGNTNLINSIIKKCRKLHDNNVPPGFEYSLCFKTSGYGLSLAKRYMNISGMFNRDTVPVYIYDEINNKVTNFLEDEELHRKLQLPWKTGFVFKGPVGTGKTLVAMDLARHFKLDLYKFECIDEFFKCYRDISERSVVLFDDVDMLLDYNRETDDELFENPKYSKESGERKMKLKQLMSIFDGYDALYGCILIFITNYIDRIDPALIRPGRLDFHIQFGNLPHETVVSTLKKYYGRDIDIPEELSSIEITISKLMTNYIVPNLKDYESCINGLLLLIPIN